MAPSGTEGLVWSGGEDAWPFNEIAVPAPRGHLAKTKRSTGWLLMQKLAEAAVAAGADVSYDTRVERLVVDDGRVVGAVATRYGERVAVKAHRGVVLTAGRIHLERRDAAPPRADPPPRDLEGRDRGRRRPGDRDGPGGRGPGQEHARGGGVTCPSSRPGS